MKFDSTWRDDIKLEKERQLAMTQLEPVRAKEITLYKKTVEPLKTKLA